MDKNNQHRNTFDKMDDYQIDDEGEHNVIPKISEFKHERRNILPNKALGKKEAIVE